MQIRELMSELAYNNCNISELAATLGMSRSSIYRKLSGKCDFTCSEIAKIKSKLNMSDETLVKIFFTGK